MYSATFAITVVLGIALTNLFLGFAAALLIGRGPKRWSDLEKLIEVRLLTRDAWKARSRPRMTATKVTACTVDAETPSATIAADEAARAPTRDTPPTGESPEASKTVSGDSALPATGDRPAGSGAQQPAGTAPTAPVAPPPQPARKLTLEVKAKEEPVDDRPPAEVLDAQLDEWREAENREPAPSAAMLSVVPPADVDASLQQLLFDATLASITKQLRRDRRVLCIDPGRYVWFMEDLQPEDALTPVERIRQLIRKTRFEHGERRMEVVSRAAIVVGLDDDTAERLLHRLQVAMEFLQSQRDQTTVIDTGDGPQLAEPFELEVGESRCPLDA